MPIKNRFAEMLPEITAWRRHLHENPELLYEVHETAAFVAEKLRAFGVDEVTEGVGQTGVVGVIRGKQNGSGRAIALRADMDALPIEEMTGLPYASQIPGKMHACGHDGHTAMLLGAAKYLAETRNFDGDVVLIFQPAEEGGAGAKAMIDDGLFQKWHIDEIYGIHNAPGIPVGRVRHTSRPTCRHPRMSSRSRSKGKSAAMPRSRTARSTPHLVAAQIIVALHIPLLAGRSTRCAAWF
jgi:amidohydrolase